MKYIFPTLVFIYITFPYKEAITYNFLDVPRKQDIMRVDVSLCHQRDFNCFITLKNTLRDTS